MSTHRSSEAPDTTGPDAEEARRPAGAVELADPVDRILVAARSQGWREALAQECATSAELLRYATDPREGDCLRLLPDIKPRCALFVGNSLAILPFLLSEYFDSVVVADSDPRRVEFARERQKQDNVRNLTCVLAPTARDRFDLVAVGEESPGAAVSTPRDPRTLGRLASLVAEGGCLMYGVRFRLWKAIAMTLVRPRHMGASAFYPAHARFLSTTAFSTVRGYWRRPRGRPYQMYVPLDDDAVVEYWIRSHLQGRSIRARCTAAMTLLACRVGHFAYLIDNFLVIARRP